MEVEQRVAVEADLLCGLHEKFDSVLVVEDHLRFPAVFAVPFFPGLDQAMRFEQRIGVALETARVPGQGDQEPAQQVSGIGAGRLIDPLERADFAQPSALFRGEIEGLVGPVGVEEGDVVAHRAAGLYRLADVFANPRPRVRQRRQHEARRSACGKFERRR